MNKYSKTIIESALLLFNIQKICFASELDGQSDTSLAHIVNHIPFSSSPESIDVQNHLPAVAQINKQLQDGYSQINPEIKLSVHSHAEISRLSAKYESFPTDISYNHDRNQVTLIWKTGAYGIFKPKTRTETFDLGTRSIPAFATQRPTARSKITTAQQSIPPSRAPTRIIETDQSSISSNDSTLSMTCLPGNSSRYLQQKTQLKTYVFRPEISLPRNIYEGQAAFNSIYSRFPDIHTNFTLTTHEFNRIARDFVRYGCPAWLNVAADDNHAHMLIFEWINTQKFYYRLTWKKPVANFSS